MGKTNFTKQTLEKLPVRAKRYNVFDSNTRCLGIAVYSTGTKTFFHLKKVQGWPERTLIGPFPDVSVEHARGKASELNAKLAQWKSNGYEGRSPLVERRKVPTLGAVFEHYIENHLRPNAKNADRAIKSARLQFDCYLSSWRERPLSSIRREHVREKHAEIGAKSGRVTANRTVTFLRTLYNHAIHPDVALWDGVNPAQKPKKFLFEEESRERTIQRDEAPKFFAQLANERHHDLRDFVLLALSIGARRGSILAMRWDEIDFERRLWTISNPKSRKKNARPHIVPLTKFAVQVLKARTDDSSEWVFAGRKGHLTTLKKPWAALLTRAKIENLRIHDLRRSLATAEGETGASTEVIQKTLGHEEASAATKIYDRSQRRDDVREAMDAAMRSLLAAGKTSRQKLLSGGVA